MAIGAAVLAIVAVTFGVVAVLAQHLSETYARAISELFNRTAIWKTAVVGEGIAFVLSVTLAYWRPDATSGVVAILLAVTSLVESWFAITQLLKHFDATAIIVTLRASAQAALERESDKSAAAIRPSQAILNLVLTAAGKGDVEVVGSGLAAWNDILGRYLEIASIVWSDPYLYWLYGRCSELVEEYAKQSVGLVLPVVVRGIGDLARTTASSSNPLNAALDEGTSLFTGTLRSAVMMTGQAPRSTAAGEAIEGIGATALACLGAGKFTVAQFPIDELKTIGFAASTVAPAIASQATIKLCEIALALAATSSDDVMRSADAEDAVGAIHDIALKTIPRTGLDPIHFLTAPLSSTSLPLLCQTLALAAQQSNDAYSARPWDDLTRHVTDLGLVILQNPKLNAGMRWNAVESAGCVVLGLIATQRVQPYLELIRRICNELVSMCLDNDGPRNADEVLPSILLAVYEASSTFSDLRHIVTDAGAALKAADEAHRIRLAPIARQVGATALNRGDKESATLMAEAALPEPPTYSHQVRTAGDAFRMRNAIRPAGLITRPGLILPKIPADYLDQAAQMALLELEGEVHSAAEG